MKLNVIFLVLKYLILMKFVVSTSSLLKHLQIVSGVVGTNNILPILEDFLFIIDGKTLTISGTDLETSITTQLDVESNKSGKIAIPAKILLDTLKTLPEQPITIDVDEETFGVQITTDNGKYKMAGENGEDYPKIPDSDGDGDIKLPGNVLVNAISKTLFAVSNEDLRPAMNGVFFELNAEGTTFVATDAHKLVRYRRKEAVSKEPASFIVPKKALNLLKNILPNKEDVVHISYNRNNAFFSFNNISLVCRLIDARFPDYNAVIPIDNPNQMQISRYELLNTLRRISNFSSKSTHQVVFRVAGSELNISAQDLDFSSEANEKLLCEYLGNDMAIAFNAKFLQEMLGALQSDDVRLHMSTPTRAGILYPSSQDENEDLLMLIMPVMLNA
jgi:DNA polymerase-3 subunit beta